MSRRGARAAALGLLLGCAAPGLGGPEEAPVDGVAGLAAGRFLVATRQVAGPVFEESVVLLLAHGEGGAIGVVVNKRTPVPLAALLPELEELRGERELAHLGGPVALDTLRFLVREDEAPPDATRVLDQVYVSASPEVVRRALRAREPGLRLRAYLGYAGWAPGQLDAEIQANGWLSVPADESLVFDDGLDDKWERAIGKLGIDFSKLSGEAGHA